VRYTISTDPVRWGDAALGHDTAVPPRWQADRYLQLPELSPAIADLAREITRDATTDAARVRAIENYLFVNGRYTDTPPVAGSQDGSAIERFLMQDMAAHCEYYASALVVLARSVGLPARLVNGFAGGRKNRVGGFVEVTRADAHAWVEVHYARAGWVRYDATPPDRRVRAFAPLTFDERVREFGSALELWWFRRVVGFDRSDQILAMKRAWLAWTGSKQANARPAHQEESGGWRGLGDAPWREGAVMVLCVIAAGAAIWWLRPRRRHHLPGPYADGLALLERRGLTRGAQATAREFATAVAAAHPDAGPPFAALTEAYLGQRFGGIVPIEASKHLAALRRGLLESRDSV
jgi:transglutaminase-like putative cysteine protease